MASIRRELEENGQTPFNALDEYDRLIGEQCKEAKTWRKVAIYSMGILVLALGICFYAVNLPKTVPLIVSVSEFGEAKYIGDVSHYNYSNVKIPEAAIQYQISQFVTKYLSLSTDSEVLKQNLRDCYAVLTSMSANKFSNLLKSNDPFNDFGICTKTVHIETVLKLSDNSYQVDFRVKKLRNDGGILDTTRLRGIFTMTFLEPTEDDKRINPLGIYISNFDITEIR